MYMFMNKFMTKIWNIYYIQEVFWWSGVFIYSLNYPKINHIYLLVKPTYLFKFLISNCLIAQLHGGFFFFFFLTQVSEIYLNYKLYSFTSLCKQIKMHACFLLYASVYIKRNLFFSRADVTSTSLLSLFNGFL